MHTPIWDSCPLRSLSAWILSPGRSSERSLFPGLIVDEALSYLQEGFTTFHVLQPIRETLAAMTKCGNPALVIQSISSRSLQVRVADTGLSCCLRRRGSPSDASKEDRCGRASRAVGFAPWGCAVGFPWGRWGNPQGDSQVKVGRVGSLG